MATVLEHISVKNKAGKLGVEVNTYYSTTDNQFYNEPGDARKEVVGTIKSGYHIKDSNDKTVVRYNVKILKEKYPFIKLKDNGKEKNKSTKSIMRKLTKASFDWIENPTEEFKRAGRTPSASQRRQSLFSLRSHDSSSVGTGKRRKKTKRKKDKTKRNKRKKDKTKRTKSPLKKKRSKRKKPKRKRRRRR